jgi:hypothetical protein
MSRVLSGTIRKLQWGLNISTPNLTVQVGSRAAGKDDFTISEIVEDKNNFHEYGNFEYLIYVTKNNKDKFLWKRFVHPPDVIEYSFPGDEDFFVA